MTVTIMERDRITDIAKMEEIIELRKRYRYENEMIYTKEGIEYLASILSGISGLNIYENSIIKMYFEILEMKNYLEEKYALLSPNDAIKYKNNVDSAVKDADETLSLIEQCLQTTESSF